jgi:hypothetical protein
LEREYEEMNWDAIGAMSELVGAIAVVFTLAYLAIQIKASTRASKAVVREGVSSSLQNVMLSRLDASVLAQAGMKQNSGVDLDDSEEHQLSWWTAMWWRTYENIYYQYRNGFLEEAEWRGYENVIVNSLRDDLVLRHWKRVLQDKTMSEEFISHVERLRADLI